MPRMIFGLIGILITAGFAAWRYSLVSDLNEQMSAAAYDAVGMPDGTGNGEPPSDLATLSTPAGAFSYLNHVAETLKQMDAQYADVNSQLQAAGNQAIANLGSGASTASARGGRIMAITPVPAAEPAATDGCGLDGADCGQAAAAPAQVRVVRPRH